MREKEVVPVGVALASGENVLDLEFVRESDGLSDTTLLKLVDSDMSAVGVFDFVSEVDCDVVNDPVRVCDFARLMLVLYENVTERLSDPIDDIVTEPLVERDGVMVTDPVAETLVSFVVV